jgi:hypothetical protein
MDACEPISHANPKDAAEAFQSLAKENPKQVSIDDAGAIGSFFFCYGMLTGVVSAIANADNYEIQGSKVCIDPERSGVDYLREVIAYGKRNPDLVKDKDMDAEPFLILALKDEKATCVPSSSGNVMLEPGSDPLYKCGDLYTTKPKEGQSCALVK